MFKTLIRAVFPSMGQDRGLTPDYMSFERSREQACIEEEQASLKVKVASFVQSKPAPFLDYLFGSSEQSASEDPLSAFVSSKISELIQQPERLLAELPVMPTSVAKVVALLNEKSFDLNELIDVIEHEPSMAADMIKLANSSKYKRGDKHVTDLQRAFMFMGAEGLKEGVLQVFLQKFSASSNLYFKQFGEKIWAHGFNAAQYAQELAIDKLGRQEASTVYVVALLHNLGTMVIFQLMTEAFKYVDPDAHPSSANFKTLMSEQALKLTVTIAQYWRLPDSILHMLNAQMHLSEANVDGACCVSEAIHISEAKLLLDARRLTESSYIEYLQAHNVSHDSTQFALSLIKQDVSIAK